MLELYPYQAIAVEKLKAHRSRLCGDEMGTGKTVIGLELDNQNVYTQHSRSLILAPKSVHGGWERHLGMMQPGRPIYRIDPKNRTEFEEPLADKTAYGVFICHYEALRLMPSVRNKKITVDHVIADEAQKIKNRQAQMTKMVKGIRTEYKTGLTGTPAENMPDDIWSILHWLYPRDFRSYWKFFRRYVEYITTEEGYNIVIGVNEDTVGELRNIIEPYYIRRTKDEVMPELPEKYWTTVEVDLTGKERKSYDAMRKEMIAWVGDQEQYPVVAPVVLAQLSRLSMYAVAYSTAKLDANGEQVFRKVVNKKTKEVEWRPVYIMEEPSAKLDAVMELLENMAGEPCVIFTNYTQVLDLLEARLADTKISWVRLDGNTTQPNRDAAISRFQRGDAQLFIGTYGAGGIGIELYRASRLIRIDRPWSPSLDKQAEDRLHRRGQQNAVQIIDIVARNTVDMQKRRKLIQKWDWIKQVIDQGYAA